MHLAARSPVPFHPTLSVASARFLRLPEVLNQIEMSRSSMYDAIKRDDLPALIPLGGKSVAWLSNEIETWKASRVAARRH
ncbi:helix-turn-helix transcriptional regulator [Paludibacterium yongneupense]|uniref:helix-turn-helix transcriptional regulator n=1 Tax=Paludibacterium yongneupense TaxID=400061 RepID=UPI00040A705E|nr:AlpA family phage regulatory protein [Paludibacterium yongneupense]